MTRWQWLLSVFLLIPLIPISVRAQDIVKEFDAPGPESRGLAWDGTYLWCADAELDSIFKIDPATGQEIHAIPFVRNFEFSRGGGITWSGEDALWVTHRQYFYKLNSTNGQETANFHCPGS